MLTIYGMAVANALFPAFLLVVQHRNTNPAANRWLAGFLLTVAGLMADDFRDTAGVQISPCVFACCGGLLGRCALPISRP